MYSKKSSATQPNGFPPDPDQPQDAPDSKKATTSKGPKSRKQKWTAFNMNSPTVNASTIESPSAASRPANSANQSNSRANTGMGFNSPTGDDIDQGNDIAAAMQKVSLEPETTTTLREPLKEFHLFPDLPAEIRCKIWKFSFAPRLLEVHRDVQKAIDKGYPGAHNHHRINPKSSTLPDVVYTCHEAWDEAMRAYVRRDFTDSYNYEPAPADKWIYFNPGVDIIYFGEGSCMQNVVRFFYFSNYIKGYDIQRVAILCSGQITNCHPWEDDPNYGPDEYSCDLGHTIAGGCTVMQALHGIEKSIAWNRMAPGCKELKEVFWVVKSQLMPLKAGEIHNKVIFRPAIGNGLTKGQQTLKAKIEKEVAQVESGLGVEGVGENKWVGEAIPTFKFMSLAPIPAVGKKYDSMVISAKNLNKLNAKVFEFVKEVQKWSGSTIQVCELEYPTQKEVEVGFYGTESEITYAKNKIEEKLKSRGDYTRGGGNTRRGGSSRGARGGSYTRGGGHTPGGGNLRGRGNPRGRGNSYQRGS